MRVGQYIEMATPEQVRGAVQRERDEGKTTTQIAAQWGISRRQLFDFQNEGVRAVVSDVSAKMLQVLAEERL